MSVIVSLLSTDALEPTSRTNINTNFANLNTDKQEKPGGAVANNIVLFGVSNVLVDSGKAVPTGTIVGTTDTQVLTNKDLTSGTNTFPSTLVTTTGTQTLTNKTLTSPILTTPTIADFTNANHNHQNAAGGGVIAEAAFSFSNNTTANATSSQHGLLPKLSGVSTDVFHGDDTFSAGNILSIVASTIFETGARFGQNINSGTIAFATTGAIIRCASSASSTVLTNLFWQLTGSSSTSAIDDNAQFSCVISVGQTTSSTGTFYAGIGLPTNSGFDFTQVHVGWKIVGASSDQKLFATVGDGTAETASSALLTGLTANDTLELLVVMNNNSSATFYYRKNGGSQSSVVLNTHIPAAGTAQLHTFQFVAGNNNVANTFGATAVSAHWQR